MSASFTKYAQQFLDLAFPASCVSCVESVVDSDFGSVCSSCAEAIQIVQDPRCLTCGFPFFGETESQAQCLYCEHLRPEFGRCWSIALFRMCVRDLIHALKYRDGFWALPDLRKLAERSQGLDVFLEGACLVPVPLHARKQRERGYNQSKLIAQAVSEAYAGTSVRELLSRTVDTVSQTRFNRNERVRNLRNAFSLGKKAAIDPAERYVVVDDVFTTGSTVNACAAALRRGGARRVDVLAVGHG